MRFRVTFILCVSFLIMTAYFGRTVSHTTVNNQYELARVKIDPKRACLAESDLSNALQRLSLASSQSEADQSRDLLLEESRRSPSCAKQVIAIIMRAMDKPDLDFTREPEMYYVWRDGADLLGELKAAEALDLLISHLDLRISGRSSTTMSQQPSLAGVIKMGPIAIPKLSALLKDSPNRDMRRYAVYCIAGIGGPAANSALRQALASESDQCVRQFIAVSIDTIDNKSGGLKQDTVKWYLAFQCQ